MKLTIENTGEMCELDGVPCRVWKGTSDKGVGVIAFIHRIAVEENADHTQFEAELNEQPPPADVEGWPEG